MILNIGTLSYEHGFDIVIHYVLFCYIMIFIFFPFACRLLDVDIKMFSVLTALLSPQVMKTLDSHKELLFQTLRERAGVLCVQPSDGMCFLQGEWEGIKKAYMVLEEFCLQVQAQSTVQALLHTDDKPDGEGTTRETPPGSKGEVYPDSTRTINFTKKSYSNGDKDDMDSESEQGLSIAIPDDDDDDDDFDQSDMTPDQSDPTIVVHPLPDFRTATLTSSSNNNNKHAVSHSSGSSTSSNKHAVDNTSVSDSSCMSDRMSESMSMSRMSLCVKEEEQAQAMLDEVAADAGLSEAEIGISRSSIFPAKFNKNRFLPAAQLHKSFLPEGSGEYLQDQSKLAPIDSLSIVHSQSELVHDIKPSDDELHSPIHPKSAPPDVYKSDGVSNWPFPYPNALNFLRPNIQKPDVPASKPLVVSPVLSPDDSLMNATLSVDPSLVSDGSPIPNWCPFCSRLLENEDIFEKHMMQSHGQHIVYNCKLCGSTLSSRSEFQQHMRNHTNDMHACPVCGKSYKSGQRLREHILLHDKNYVRPRYPCPVCYKTFTYRHNMQVHLMKLHRGKQPPKRHECHLCGQKFLKPVYLRTHLMRHTETARK